MRTTAVLPIKRFGAAKSRLSQTLSPAARADLAEAMLTDVLAGLSRAERIERVIVVSGEPRAASVASEADVELIDDRDDDGHSEAALLGVGAALAAGAECAALLPGDCPLLDPRELDAALAEVAPGTASVIPDRHGSGTNGLLLAPPDAMTPSFGPGSRERHLELARAAGVVGRLVEIPSLGLDLDTPDDLIDLTRVAAENPHRAPATARALEELGLRR
ncbi:MAG: 2-phospho-L-lactate guanylyltransferase [Solirubrobacterales bacterium]